VLPNQLKELCIVEHELIVTFFRELKATTIEAVYHLQPAYLLFKELKATAIEAVYYLYSA
jgi:hypothetical protein